MTTYARPIFRYARARTLPSNHNPMMPRASSSGFTGASLTGSSSLGSSGAGGAQTSGGHISVDFIPRSLRAYGPIQDDIEKHHPADPATGDRLSLILEGKTNELGEIVFTRIHHRDGRRLVS